MRVGGSGRDDGAVKRSTTIRHLVEMAEVATERMRLRETDIGWPLEEMWVTGELLGFAETLEAGAVVLVRDLPADDLSWLTLHPAGEWIGDQLRLGKRPLRWCYRPLTWPVWNHEHRRLVRFWSASGDLDLAVVEAPITADRSRDRRRAIRGRVRGTAARGARSVAPAPPSDARHLLGPRLAAPPRWP